VGDVCMVLSRESALSGGTTNHVRRLLSRHGRDLDRSRESCALELRFTEHVGGDRSQFLPLRSFSSLLLTRAWNYKLRLV
jgi:hypothetical protein